jgi:Amt family ammonium transporter
MRSSILHLLFALGLALVGLSPASAEDAAAAPAAEPAVAAAPAAAAAPAPTIEERLTAVEAAAKTGADSANQVAFNAGDNAWVLVSSLLVLMMTIPGLALFYGGLVRKKNVLATMMQSFALAGVVSVIWGIFGYAVAFGDAGPFWGGLSHFVFLDGVIWDSAAKAIPGPNGDYAMSIPHGSFMVFQMMFAIITPALITGAFAERMKFSAMLLFTVLWFCIIYLPLAHMVWGKNGLFNWGFGATTWAAFDFAGGTVVHISSGFAALMAALIVGKRKGYPSEPMPPHSIVLSFIGASLLWVGWFGFNAGSALGCGTLATLAFSNTHMATAAAAITWPLAEWIIRGKPTVLGGISGAVAGLVAITPACGFVTPSSALIIGGLAGVICFSSSSYLKKALGYDDALDAFGVHGVGGTWGALATGIFFNPDVNPGLKGLNAGLYDAIVKGEHAVLPGQIKAVLITILMTVIGASVILFIVKAVIGLRPSADEEDTGLDLSQHGEEGYHGV